VALGRVLQPVPGLHSLSVLAWRVIEPHINVRVAHGASIDGPPQEIVNTSACTRFDVSNGGQRSCAQRGIAHECDDCLSGAVGARVTTCQNHLNSKVGFVQCLRCVGECSPVEQVASVVTLEHVGVGDLDVGVLAGVGEDGGGGIAVAQVRLGADVEVVALVLRVVDGSVWAPCREGAQIVPNDTIRGEGAVDNTASTVQRGVGSITAWHALPASGGVVGTLGACHTGCVGSIVRCTRTTRNTMGRLSRADHSSSACSAINSSSCRSSGDYDAINDGSISAVIAKSKLGKGPIQGMHSSVQCDVHVCVRGSSRHRVRRSSRNGQHEAAFGGGAGDVVVEVEVPRGDEGGVELEPRVHGAAVSHTGVHVAAVEHPALTGAVTRAVRARSVNPIIEVGDGENLPSNSTSRARLASGTPCGIGTVGAEVALVGGGISRGSVGAGTTGRIG
jgi:hypothetical protein